MNLRGRQIIEPKMFRKWWKTTINNADAERSDEIFNTVKNIKWVRMPAGREFDPRGLQGEINKGKMVLPERCDPDYQYYYYGQQYGGRKDKLYLLWPNNPTEMGNYGTVGTGRWTLQSFGTTVSKAAWSLGINDGGENLFHAAINKQFYP